MIIHKNDYLQVTFEKSNDLITSYWFKSPENDEVFKKEMLSFLKVIEQHQATNTIWLQENFFLDADINTHNWIEEHINKPAYNLCVKNVAFVVGRDLAAHLNISNYFKNNDSVFEPWHFASEEDAKKWIFSELKTSEKTKQNTKTKIIFAGVDEDGNPIFKLTSSSHDITDTIKFLNSYLERDKITELFAEKYASLSDREKEITSHFSKGKKLTEIAEDFFISVHTIRTHWKNIKKKLGVTDNNKIIEIHNIIES